MRGVSMASPGLKRGRARTLPAPAGPQIECFFMISLRAMIHLSVVVLSGRNPVRGNAHALVPTLSLEHAVLPVALVADLSAERHLGLTGEVCKRSERRQVDESFAH